MTVVLRVSNQDRGENGKNGQRSLTFNFKTGCLACLALARSESSKLIFVYLRRRHGHDSLYLLFEASSIPKVGIPPLVFLSYTELGYSRFSKVILPTPH